MYNRYVRNDAGRYERIPAPDAPPPESEARVPPESEAYAGDGCPPPHDSRRSSSPPPNGREKQGILDRILGRLNLDGIDTGDLLLLVILFLLFKDGEDEELLIALGLLLIL